MTIQESANAYALASSEHEAAECALAAAQQALLAAKDTEERALFAQRAAKDQLLELAKGLGV